MVHRMSGMLVSSIVSFLQHLRNISRSKSSKSNPLEMSLGLPSLILSQLMHPSYNLYCITALMVVYVVLISA